MVYVIGSTKNDVVVHMVFVDVCCHNVGIFFMKKPVRKLHSYVMRFLIGNLSREKRLDQMEGFVI